MRSDLPFTALFLSEPHVHRHWLMFQIVEAARDCVSQYPIFSALPPILQFMM
jgi:hypothetical protein